MDDQAKLAERLELINQRLASIAKELGGASEFCRSELEYERRDLATQRSITERALAELVTPPDPTTTALAAEQAARRAAFIEHELKVRRQQTENWVRELERQGDHHQARLWRGTLLSLRQTVEREYPP